VRGGRRAQPQRAFHNSTAKGFSTMHRQTRMMVIVHLTSEVTACLNTISFFVLGQMDNN
jgi:hypothetical protein